MKDESVLDAAQGGAGPVSVAARELHELERALADSARADELDALVERYGEAQARFESLSGYGLEARARGGLAGRRLPAGEVGGGGGGRLGGGERGGRR